MAETFDVHYKRGLDFLKNNQLDEAIAEFQKAIKVKSEHSESYYHLGLSYKQNGQFNEAIREFQKYLKLNQKDIECRKELVFLYLDLEEYEKAKDEFTKIIDVDKSDFEFLSQFGSKLSNSDDEQHIKIVNTWLEKANRINPSDIKSRIRLLEFYINSCELPQEDEIKFLKELLEIDPSNLNVIMKIAVTYGFFDNRRIEKKCIAALKENLEKNPDKIQACADFTFAMLAAADDGKNIRKELLNETLKNIPELLDKQPKSNNKVLIQAYTDLAYTYGRLNQKERERETWEKIIQFASDFKILAEVDFIDNISYCYEQDGKLAKLARFYQQILRSKNFNSIFINKNNDIRLSLGRTYIKLKKYNFAKDELEKIPKISHEWKAAQADLQEVNQIIERIESLERKVDRLERELRAFIETQLLKNKWDFDSEKKNNNLLKKIENERIKKDLNTFRYLSIDDINPFDYFQLFECFRIMETYWDDSFNQIFPDKDELEKKIEDISNFRNAVKHNRSIEDPIIGYCEGSVDWVLKMMEKESRN